MPTGGNLPETGRAKFDIGVRASPRDPAKFTEDMSPRAQPRTGFGKDSVEIESYVRGLARRRPDVVVTTLRLANLMGRVDSHVTRYLSLPVVPRVMGFDARLQFLHPSDAVDALLLVTRRDVPEPSTWRRPMSSLSPGAPQDGSADRRRPEGHCAVGCHAGTPGAAGGLLSRPDRRADLRSCHGHVPFHVQTGFVPKFTSLAALEEFVGVSKVGLLSPERVDSALEAVRRVLGTAAVRNG